MGSCGAWFLQLLQLLCGEEQCWVQCSACMKVYKRLDTIYSRVNSYNIHDKFNAFWLAQRVTNKGAWEQDQPALWHALVIARYKKPYINLNINLNKKRPSGLCNRGSMWREKNSKPGKTHFKISEGEWGSHSGALAVQQSQHMDHLSVSCDISAPPSRLWGIIKKRPRENRDKKRIVVVEMQPGQWPAFWRNTTGRNTTGRGTSGRNAARAVADFLKKHYG